MRGSGCGWRQRETEDRKQYTRRRETRNVVVQMSRHEKGYRVDRARAKKDPLADHACPAIRDAVIAGVCENMDSNRT